MRLAALTPLAFALTIAFGGVASAQAPAPAAPDPLRDAAQKAISTNPEVAAKLDQFRAAVEAVDIARAGWRPQVSVDASVAHDRDRITSRNPATGSLNRSGAALNLSQLLWDFGAVKADVERLGHDKLARYFELLDTTEQTAFEATRAYLDVQRYRRLVELAEDSYVQHRYVLKQIQSRFQAGVGRGVDNEQALARVALSETNLTTEVSNLHDVTARYLRVVGEAPAVQLPPARSLAGAIPTSPGEAMAEALRNNPAVQAAIENLRSARENASLRQSALMPRVEARVRAGGGHNFDGVVDQRYDASGQIVLNWSLYDGGANQARIRQAARLVDQAADLRDKTCRDVRQAASIAYNDTRKLQDLITALDRNVLSIEKARDAYRQQFDIGQRSLLDLLNSENELYTARRAYANAQYDLEVARLRSLATGQRLTTQLGLARMDLGGDAEGAQNWDAGADVPSRCPAVFVEVQPKSLSDLDARAQSLVNSAPRPQPAQPAPVAPAASTPKR
jgi:adhesin transport system outer membrane protein